MLDVTKSITDDALEQELIEVEYLVGRLRARQVELLRDADARQVPTRDGCATLKEWIAGRLDVAPSTAGQLAVLARSDAGHVQESLEDGTVSFDRAAATQRLVNAGADEVTVARSAGVAVHHVSRLVARQRRLTPMDEAAAFESRRLVLQPNLDRTVMSGTLRLSGTDADMLVAALDARADELCDRSDPDRPQVAQRRVDALVSLALDDRTAGNPRRPQAQVFVDAELAARTHGEAGALTESGLQLGVGMLEEILCVGTTSVTIVDRHGLTAVPTTGPTIPARIRAYVRHRDGGCTADGCTSTYRLEPHHILPRSHGGSHDPSNLTLLCWFHHHVVVHKRHYTIDPESPPGRRRFIPPNKSPPNG